MGIEREWWVIHASELSCQAADMFRVATAAKERTKICVIGAGAAGLPVIKALKDLEKVKEWEVECFEQRNDVGGIW